MNKFDEIRKLATMLDHLDNLKEVAQRPNVHQGMPNFDETSVMVKGISDLDFDPDLYLMSGMTAAEGWAVKYTR